MESEGTAQRQRGCGEGLRLLADELAGFAGGLDRGLLDLRDRRIELHLDGKLAATDQAEVDERVRQAFAAVLPSVTDPDSRAS